MPSEAAELPAGCVFDFSVVDPEKRGSGAFSHWVYHVHTQTTLPTFKQQKLLTVRRYNHFSWLRDQLVLEYPGCIIPPIPEKDIAGTLEKVTGGTGPSSLVAYRQRALRKFLVRVGAHAKLQNSEVLCDFLGLGDDDFAKRMKQPSKASADVVTLPASMRVGNAFSSPPNTPEYTKWEETIAYFDKLESFLGDIRSKLNKLMNGRAALGKSFTEFGSAFSQAAEIESARSSTDMGASMKAFGDHSLKQEKMLEEQANNECVHVAESITYYQGMCGAVREAVKRLIKLQMTRDLLADATSKAAQKRDAASEEQKPKMVDKHAALEAEHTRATQAASKVSAELTDELSRFRGEKTYDFKTILSTFVDLTKDYAGRTRASWESTLPTYN